MKNKKGISLIILAITIIVMTILAGTIIVTTTDNGMISVSENVKLKADLEKINQQYTSYKSDKTSSSRENFNFDDFAANKTEVTYCGELQSGTITDILPILTELGMQNDIEIIDGKLTYVGENEEKIGIYSAHMQVGESTVRTKIADSVKKDGFISTAPNFTTIESGTNHLYKYHTSLGYTYFFRGLCTNNYVKLGVDSNGNDIVWRIMRINEDGTVRLITSTTIGKSAYASGAASNAQYNYNTSVVKQVVDAWYLTTTLPGYYSDGILIDGKFYNDVQVYMTDSNNNTRFEPRHRAWANMGLQMPEFVRSAYVCTVANGKLTYPIAIPSSDDGLAAGMVQGIESTSNSIYYAYLSWTMSAGTTSSGGSRMPILIRGNFGNDGCTLEYGVRPVININGNQLMRGKGTAASPYRIS